MYKWFSSASEERANGRGGGEERIKAINLFSATNMLSEVSGRAWGLQWSEWLFPALRSLYSCLLRPGGAGPPQPGAGERLPARSPWGAWGRQASSASAWFPPL